MRVPIGPSQRRQRTAHLQPGRLAGEPCPSSQSMSDSRRTGAVWENFPTAGGRAWVSAGKRVPCCPACLPWLWAGSAVGPRALSRPWAHCTNQCVLPGTRAGSPPGGPVACGARARSVVSGLPVLYIEHRHILVICDPPFVQSK